MDLETTEPYFVNFYRHLSYEWVNLNVISSTAEIITQRWKFKLSVPGLYKNTIPTPPGMPWLSSYPKLSVEHMYIGFVLIL